MNALAALGIAGLMILAIMAFVVRALHAVIEASMRRRVVDEDEDEDDPCTCNPLENTGGGHSGDCPAFEPECTCYESWAGHQPGCYFNAHQPASTTT